jgi:hypothetical protein
MMSKRANRSETVGKAHISRTPGKDYAGLQGAGVASGGADCCASSLECVGIYASFRYFHRWAFPRNRDQGVVHHLSVLSILS